MIDKCLMGVTMIIFLGALIIGPILLFSKLAGLAAPSLAESGSVRITLNFDKFIFVDPSLNLVNGA